MNKLREIVRYLGVGIPYAAISKRSGVSIKCVVSIARSTGKDSEISLRRSILLKRVNSRNEIEIRKMLKEGNLLKKEIADVVGVYDSVVSRVAGGKPIIVGKHDKFKSVERYLSVLTSMSGENLDKVAEKLKMTKQRVSQLYEGLYQSGTYAYPYRLGQYIGVNCSSSKSVERFRVVSLHSPRKATVIENNMFVARRVINRLKSKSS